MARGVEDLVSEVDAPANLREILDAIPHIAWVTDPDGQIKYINARWTALTGVDGLNMEEIVSALHPEDVPSVLASMETARATGTRTLYEVRIKSKEGEYRWHRVEGSALRSDDGSVRCWIGTSTDIHEQHLAVTALKESEDNYRFMVDSNPQVPWVADPNGVLTDFSERWMEMTGLTREKALADGWVEVPHPDDLPSMLEAFGNAMATKTPLVQEHRSKMADGSYHWMRTQAFPRLDPDGNVVRWFGSTEDIHDRRVAEEALRQLNENLEQIVEERTAELRETNVKLSHAYREAEAFSYTASHDLRAPLRAVVSIGRLIADDYGDVLPKEVHDLLKDQANAARRMATLMDALLTHSRLGKSALKREKLDLTSLAHNTLEALSDRNPLVKTSVQEGLVCEGDPHLVGVLLQNLIENSLVYSPKGGQMQVGKSDGAFFVSDEGIGFEMEFVKRIFEPFQRLHRDGEFPGTGIGLANVKKIVELHGGTIWARSELGRGATFYFTLA
jgi:PAS domain S-box-containing protein